MSKLRFISGCTNDQRKGDIVFIHGLGGDVLGTWRHNNKDDSLWPKWVGEEFPELAVWSLDYASSPTRWTKLFRPLARIPILNRIPALRAVASSENVGHSMPLPRRATQVLDLMTLDGVGEKPLVIVGHSLGGLLAKQILRRSHECTDEKSAAVFKNTRAVLFLATPHTGARLASMAHAFKRIFQTTVSLEDLREHDAHLEDLLNWYRHRPHIQTRTYYETKKLGPFTIVDPSSSHPGVGTDPIPLDEDHLSIAKPKDRNSQVCRTLNKLITDCIVLGTKGDSEKVAQNTELVTGNDLIVETFQKEVAVVQQVSIVIGGSGQQIAKQSSISPQVINALSEQLSRKDEQLQTQSQQIASLHKILEHNLIPNQNRTGESEPNSDSLEPRAIEWIQQLEVWLEINFPEAQKRASEIEIWLNANWNQVSKDTRVKLCHLLVRVEIVKITRELPDADMAKADELLRKASNEIN